MKQSNYMPEETCPIRPTSGRVVLRRLEQTETMKGSIHVPDVAQKESQFCLVLAVGKKRKRFNTSLTTEEAKTLFEPEREFKVGDTVIIHPMSGQKIEINERKYLIVKDEEILGVVTL